MVKVHALTVEHDGLREEEEKAATPYATIGEWDPTKLSMLGLGNEGLNG